MLTPVQGHSGRLVFGFFSGMPVVCMVGRFHFYEGYSMADIVLPIRVFRLLGVNMLLVTNASGSLNTQYEVDDIDK
jgi:purine-nucleoside phosphorylase